MSNVWEVLRAIDCNDHVEKKGKFSYLSWTWAWAKVKERYPDAIYRLEDDTVFPDGTMEVRVTVEIDGMSHTMWLPVLNHQNKAISNPDAFDINSSRMRCLVKCLAMFGLGFYIFAGESVPQGPAFTEEQKAEYIRLMANGCGFELKRFANEVGVDTLTALFNDAPKGQVTKQKQHYRDVVNAANAQLKATLNALEEAAQAGDPTAVAEITEELNSIEWDFVRAGMDEVLSHKIDELMQQRKAA